MAAALGPADDRKETESTLVQPGALLAGGEGDVGLRPLPRPEILVAVERRGSHPVVERERMRVVDAHAPLLGRVDEKEPTERPERLTAQ